LANRLVDEARGRNKLLQLFASVMSRGGWFDSDWKYVLRVQQFVHSMFPAGFPNIGAVENFLIRHFYPDLPRPGEGMRALFIALIVCYMYGRCVVDN
jgi:hypothetical protein